MGPDHADLIQLMKVCVACELCENRTQVVIGDYTENSEICIIGEGPGFNEDQIGRPFVGRSGKLLDSTLEKIGINRAGVSVLNIVKCRPPNNRAPTKNEMEICGSKWLNAQIEYLKPKVIVTLGSTALRYFIPRARMTPSKGKIFFAENLHVPIIALFHPAYILRNGNKLVTEYIEDFRLILRFLETSKITSDKGKPNAKNLTSLDDFFS